MTILNVDEFCEHDCSGHDHEPTIEDYGRGVPRWCKGCGDHGVLSAVQKVFRDKRVVRENVVCVSGIGCSSRFPHYLETYGFHGIHGRALTISTGVAISRPDLQVLTIMGDGDCFSIGAGHWLHATRYNVNLTVLVLDNEIYALTKKQASPTTPIGISTNTTPEGSYLEPFNPLRLMLGITNVSFVAQTATWLPPHMEATIARAWEHKGLAFVRVLQRCPIFMPSAYANGGQNFPAVFLENKDGIPVNKGFMKNSTTVQHDHLDLSAAQLIAQQREPAPLGLLYYNPVLPTYEDVRFGHIKPVGRKDLVEAINKQLDHHTVR